MKNLIILLFVFFGYTALQAQVPDTTAYLKHIDSIKSQYIGKTFDQLEKDLKIKIVYFSPTKNIHYDRSKETSTWFYFKMPEDLADIRSWYIEVFWEPYLNANISGDIFDAEEDANWTAAAKAFYSKGIIKDIRVKSAKRKVTH
jgi:hypothetical protein